VDQEGDDVNATFGAGPLGRCGTFEGYEDHRRHGETTCQSCRDANAARIKAYRQANGRPAGDAMHLAARYRATQALIDAHPDEFRALLHQEQSKARQIGQEAT
jgi:hypothetical protein